MARSNHTGFTLIELALSMVFVGILSLSIALIISDTVASYKRGLTLNQINTVGMDLVDDFRTAVQNSASRAATKDCVRYYSSNSDAYLSNGSMNPNGAMARCINDNAYNFTYWVKKANVKLNGTSIGTVPIYGAFCTGTYSYIWNSGYFETEDAEFDGKNGGWAKLVYSMNGSYRIFYRSSLGQEGYATISNVNSAPAITTNDRPFRLLKVRDDYRGVCAGVIRNKNNNSSTFSTAYTIYNGNLNSIVGFDNKFNMTDYSSVTEEPEDIIVTDKTYDLALYNLFVARPAVSSTENNTFYSASFVLGTIGGGINVLAKGKSCATPNDYENNENFDYCAINKFSFSVQVGGEGS
ncbi:prepilin-type N-terminal cleavage/methylation domain-containing protein [Candidatus Saccharibacteria bacterium]|nr:prepilin-type N-terminal cleavage/methylation domain-containing protein [Candidatus Saccharibacteria bacterium]